MIRRCATVVATVVLAFTGGGVSAADPGPDPVQLADTLVADEQAVRDPATPEPVLIDAAHRQQVAYREIARHPEWDAANDPVSRPLFAAFGQAVRAWSDGKTIRHLQSA